ncbi:S-layer homology domain-containing protein [Anoxynatronum buryatiense]|uniref:Ig-like domain (Group 4) n=1 Tax=Anoxynatronum buryatiense TaxID=489973 RepID=A0AA46AK09_9CLOT|nr:S-layer homology domain-containing protein [Anoxynatronum buryatiense]SMP66566.1 Ig-like domain (group 4) [Anoxynatronum buryatiense]
MKQTRKQIGSLLMAVCLIFTMLPIAAFADSTSEITAFADLAEEVALQEVAFGTPEEALTLPGTLNVTITSGVPSTATVSTWVYAPVYDSNTAGTYTLTPTLDLSPDVTLAPGVTPPTITVKVLEFVPVTGITQVQDTLGMGNSVTLIGTVAPANASNQAISWSIKDAGTTGASITEGTLFAPVDGTVTVTATIANGIEIGTDYTQDFTLTVNRLPYTFNWWSVRSPLAEGDLLRSTCYGNGTFVAVGDNGTILTSPDGVTRTTRNSGTTNDLWGVTYGNGTFVAVGKSETILTSPDGVTWTTRKSGGFYLLKGVGYGNNMFVAVGWVAGGVGMILTSPDGVTWTPRTSGTTNNLIGVSYGNSTFVVVGSSGTILTSADGVTWTPRTSGTTNELWGVSYGNSTFVAVGSSGTIQTSADGVTWTPRTSGITNHLRGVSCVNSTFVAVGTGGIILTSPDGETWTTQTSGTTNELWGASYGNGTFVAVGRSRTVLTSPNGETWANKTYGTTNDLYGVSYGNGTFVAVGSGGTILTSLEGMNWISQTSGTPKDLYGVSYGNGTFVAVGRSGTILTSPDGEAWTPQISGTTNLLFGVSYGNGIFAVVGDVGIILTSPDGVTWTRQDYTMRPLRGVSYGNSTFVAVGAFGDIRTSPDGVTWTFQTSGNANYLMEVIYGNSTFMAVGASGTVLTSRDGVTWTSRTSGSAIYGSLSGVSYGNGAFVAVGDNGIIWISQDGVTWTPQIFNFTDDFYPHAVSYANGIFVTVGDGGYIIQSGTFTTYAVTVNSGIASPSTAGENTTVTITANTAPSGKQFKEWTVESGGITLVNPQASSTTFTMPARAVEITATYEDLPVAAPVITKHPQNVTVLEGDTATFTITADNATSYQWYTTASDNDIPWDSNGRIQDTINKVSGATTSTLTINNVTEKMNGAMIYCNAYGEGNSIAGSSVAYLSVSVGGDITEHAVTVNSGTASPSTAAENTTVSITANTAPSGKQFKEWTVESGGITLVNPQASSTTFTMPANDVEITATYENIPAGVTPVTGVTLNRHSLSLYSNTTPKTAVMTAAVAPASATDQSVTWQSSNTSVATVDTNGTVRAIGNGTTTITVRTTDGGYTANCTVTVSTYTSGDGSSSGSSSGGNSSSGSSATNAITVTENQPNQPITAVASVTATAGTNGTASAAIPDKAVTDAISKAQAEATKQEKTENGIAIALTVAMPKDTTALTATFSRNALNSLVSAGVTHLEINGAPVRVTFDQKALREIQKQTSGTINITIAPKTNLTEAAKKMIGTRPVYNITVGDGNNDTVSSFGEGFATIAIPYTPANGEVISGLYAVYVDENGHATRVEGSAYHVDSGSVRLTTPHFSMYGVGYTAPSEKLTDISTHWAKENIAYLVDNEILPGITETTFAPDTAMTREMLVAALGRLAEANVSSYTTSSFTDVKVGSAFQPYIEWAHEKGIIRGIGNDQFAPERAITREEIAVIVTKFTKATEANLPVTREATTYADDSSINSTYKTAVIAMQQAGIMTGGTNNTFNPKSNATRAEVSSMLHRYIKLTVD